MPGFGFHVDGKHFKNRALDSSCVTVNFSPPIPQTFESIFVVLGGSSDWYYTVLLHLN